MGNLTPEIIIREIEVEYKRFVCAFNNILSYRSKAKATNESFSIEQKNDLKLMLNKFYKKVDGMHNYIHKDDDQDDKSGVGI